MDLLTLLIAVVSVILTLHYIRSNKRYNAKQIMMINAFPGPKTYPFVGTTWPILFMKREELFTYFRKMVKEYGPAFRQWFGGRAVVHLSDPQYIELVLSNSTHIDKGIGYSDLHPWLGDGLLTGSGSRWFRHRKLITPTFHFKILETFMDVFVEKSEKLVEILSPEANGKEFNIFPYITHCALDIIAKTAMGIEIDAMSNKSNEYVSAVYGICEMIISRSHRPWLHPQFIFKKSEYGKKFFKYVSIMHGTTNKVIDERQMALKGKTSKSSGDISEDIGQKKRLAFLDLLLDISEDGTVLTREQIREEVDTFMFEGHDTTTASICWTIFLLAIHPEVQEKTYEEIVSVSPHGQTLSFNDLNELKLLERVIKESLRMYPSVGAIARTANEDIKIGNNTIPTGCNVNIQIYDLHWNPKYYPNPEKFDPERFLPENTKNRHPYAYIPFSAGPRNCIGQRFALSEEKTVLSYLLRNYKFKCSQTMENISPVLELIIRPLDGLNVTLEKRKLFTYFRKMVKDYGPVFRQWFGGRPVIHLSDPQYIELILSNSTHIDKGIGYAALHPWLGDGLLTSSGSRWFRHRKLITPTFHFKILETFMDVFVEKSEKLVEILSVKANGKEFNILPYITHCALDIIAKTAMGIEIDAMSNKSNEYVSAVYGVCEVIMSRSHRPWLHPQFIFKRSEYGKKFFKYVTIMHEITNKVIDERQRTLKGNTSKSSEDISENIGQKKRLAFLDLLLEISEGGTVLTREQIREEVDTFMFEGHDTTTASISWTIFLLAIHPEIQEKTYEEIVSVSPHGQALSFNDLNDLKLLERVIKESLRMFPSVGAIARTAKEDIKIGNNTIPTGCNVNIQIYDLHWNTKYFPNPEKFDPDRFLPENTKSRHPFAYIPFSAGPRNCIGQRFALSEEKTVLSYLLRNYKFKCSQTMENISPVLELVIRPLDGLNVTLEKRN